MYPTVYTAPITLQTYSTVELALHLLIYLIVNIICLLTVENAGLNTVGQIIRKQSAEHPSEQPKLANGLGLNSLGFKMRTAGLGGGDCQEPEKSGREVGTAEDCLNIEIAEQRSMECGDVQ
jgi:hypothetical protein